MFIGHRLTRLPGGVRHYEITGISFRKTVCESTVTNSFGQQVGAAKSISPDDPDGSPFTPGFYLHGLAGGAFVMKPVGCSN